MTKVDITEVGMTRARCTLRAPSPRSCRERVGVRGIDRAFGLAEMPPHPLASLATSPRKRGEAEFAARSVIKPGARP